MIVKILKKSATFKAVRYNTSKVVCDRGELVLVKNFDLLQGIENLRPQDYINYLEAVSSKSIRIKFPQFHVVISAKGRVYSKGELSTIAQQWMQGMGYGKQPYMLIYHKDTANNHIHIVSTRIDRQGKKINDSYEKIRAYRVLNQILGENEHYSLAKYIQNAFAYNFSTRAQFTLLLELQGYACVLSDNSYKISKYGRVIDEIDLHLIDQKIASSKKNQDRIAQIRAILHRYESNHDRTLKFVDDAFSSDFSNFLHEKFGIQILFHAKNGHQPYGYTLIDHTTKNVFKGNQIKPLKEFISSATRGHMETNVMDQNHIPPIEDITQYDHILSPGSSKFSWKTPCLNADTEDAAIPHSDFDISISDDVDDEALHARKRKGKQKSGSTKR